MTNKKHDLADNSWCFVGAFETGFPRIYLMLRNIYHY